MSPSNRKSKSDAPKPRKNPKVTGERSEAAFLHTAANRGFGIAKPWGDSRRYDFIIDNGSCLQRIQVKCTESIRARAYETRATYTTGKGRAAYTKKDIDFIATHVAPSTSVHHSGGNLHPAPMLRFYPHRKAKRMRLECYREAWHLMQSQEEVGTIEIQASVEEPSTQNLVIDPNLVVLSEAKDLCNLSAPINTRKNRQTNPSASPNPWPPGPSPPLQESSPPVKANKSSQPRRHRDQRATLSHESAGGGYNFQSTPPQPPQRPGFSPISTAIVIIVFY